MGFADRYIASLSASNLRDDADHHQAEPLMAAAFASAAIGDLGPLLYRFKFASTATETLTRAALVRARVVFEHAEAVRRKDVRRQAECQQALGGDAVAAQASAGDLAQLLRLWIEEVIKRGRARGWVPENTAWDAEAAQKLYRSVAEHSLAHWLAGGCEPCSGAGVIESRSCKVCSGTGKANLAMAAGFVREHTLNMVSELHHIADSHAAIAGTKLR